MRQNKINGLLFDKDGTLFGFRESWGVWCERVLTVLCGNDSALQQRLALAAGYDLSRRTFLAGSSIVNAEAGETNRLWAELLRDAKPGESTPGESTPGESTPGESTPGESTRGASPADVAAAGRRALQDLPVVPVTDLGGLLRRLRSAGFKTGVATNDYESGAISQLRAAQIDPLFDFVCGFDSGYGGKPGPGMIHAFCEQTGLEPGQVAMIGDSTHDLQAGKSAATGLRIGVLTGPATRADLQPHADVVIDSIAKLPELLGL